MPDVLVRGLDEAAKKALAASAVRNGRSLQAELRLVLEEAARTVSQAASEEERVPNRRDGACSCAFDSADEVDKRLEKRRLIRQRALEAREALADDFPSPAQAVAEMRAERELQIEGVLRNLTWTGGPMSGKAEGKE